MIILSKTNIFNFNQMAKRNDGTGFEKLVESIYWQLKGDDKFQKVEQNIYLDGLDGKRQIDVLVQTQVAGLKISIIVECKDHKRKISVGQIDAFHSKLLDIKANKGIFISKNGFSSKSISKAKRLGITLCTAHEVLSGKWEPDLNIDILIEEIKPIGFHIEMNGTFNSEIYEKIDFLKINKIPLSKLLNSKWREGSIIFKKVQGIQEIELHELIPPYNVTDEDDTHLGVFQELKIFFELKIMLYKTSLKELKGSKILDNITEGVTNIFIEIPSLEKLDGDLKVLNIRDLTLFNGMIISIRIKPNGSLRSFEHPFISNGIEHFIKN